MPMNAFPSSSFSCGHLSVGSFCASNALEMIQRILLMVIDSLSEMASIKAQASSKHRYWNE